jgi:hypothetical protein
VAMRETTIRSRSLATDDLSPEGTKRQKAMFGLKGGMKQGREQLLSNRVPVSVPRDGHRARDRRATQSRNRRQASGEGHSWIGITQKAIMKQMAERLSKGGALRP